MRSGSLVVEPPIAGVWVDGLKAGVIPCYKAKTGKDVELVVGTPSDFSQKVMATRDRPAIDAMSFVSVLLLGGSDTLVLPLLIYQQVILLNNNFAAALGMSLLAISVVLLYAQARVFRVRGAA